LEEEMSDKYFLTELTSIFSGESENTIPEEEYFRKLLFQVELHSSYILTNELILKIFRNSLTSKPTEFDITWNALEEPGFSSNSEKVASIDELENLKNTIKFFVSDLRRLGDEVLKNPHRGLGVRSSVGSQWYNFDICSIIYAYENFCYDSSNTDIEDSNNKNTYSWNDISNILLAGKEYE
jgi:hypothetical protein